MTPLHLSLSLAKINCNSNFLGQYSTKKTLHSKDDNKTLKTGSIQTVYSINWPRHWRQSGPARGILSIIYVTVEPRSVELG